MQNQTLTERDSETFYRKLRTRAEQAQGARRNRNRILFLEGLRQLRRVIAEGQRSAPAPIAYAATIAPVVSLWDPYE